jgi:LuxR family transcriptional regulator, maltose regulon positive regulatory protein
VITDILNVESLLYNGSMSTPILATKLYIPPARPDLVPRPHLIKRLNESVHSKLTLISAPAGFGKTTLVSAWVAGSGRSAAWLSLDEADNDPARLMLYFIAALQTIAPDIGAGVLGVLRASQHLRPLIWLSPGNYGMPVPKWFIERMAC